MRTAGIAAAWAWAAAIVWLSLTPSPPEIDIRYGDKLGHFAAYGLLMFWFGQIYQTTKSRLAYAAGFVALGIGLEFLQGALGTRTYDVVDMYASTLGVLLGWAGAVILQRIRTI